MIRIPPLATITDCVLRSGGVNMSAGFIIGSIMSLLKIIKLLRGSGGSGPLITISWIGCPLQKKLDVRSEINGRSPILYIGGGRQGVALLTDQIIDPTYDRSNKSIKDHKDPIKQEYIMSYQINVDPLFQMRISPPNSNRLVTVNSVDEFDVKNIEDVADPTTVAAMINPELFHDVLTSVVLQSDQDLVTVDEIKADLEARYQGRMDLLSQLASQDLEDLYEEPQIYDDPIDQAVLHGLSLLDIQELIRTDFEELSDPVPHDRYRYEATGVRLLIAGRVLKELSFGTAQEVTIRA